MKCEKNLNNVFCTEEKSRFTFDRFVEIHIPAHNDMLLVPDYVFPNPATRVRKLLLNIRSNNPTLLGSITSVQTSTTFRNDFDQTVDTLQSEIRAKNMMKNRKQRISALTGGRGGRGGRGGGGCGGGGNHYQDKQPYKGGNGGHRAHGGRGSSNKRVRLNDHGNPPHGIYCVEDKLYEPGFYAKYLSEQKTQLYELRNSRSATPPTTQKLASVESRLL